ncbi:MAG: 3-hydroxyacyl-CoA dehydrogenase NAD-binding domain-containing protein [Bacteroidales bacterium]|nr:3-hydroxyacyl-CoA dehydrogenase NAD-binding domain-containing protein [Bacteroidales bacterium]
MAEMIVEPIEKYGLSKESRPKILFSKVGIVGCGRVGKDLVITASKHGIEVVFLELSEELIHKSMDEIARDLDQEINQWGLTPGEKTVILSKIRGTVSYEDFHDCELVIETIKSQQRTPSFEMRKEVFRNIEKVVNDDCIIATNSSTIVVTELSSELIHKERCVSLHISTTAPGASVVELAKGLHTSDEAYEKVIKFVQLLGKLSIPVIESPGLVSVRLFVVFLNEACETLMEGVCSMEDIDLTMRSSMNMPLGPFEFADKVGLDKIMRWMENLYSEFGMTRYIASPMIKKLVRANRLGRISGRGFYEYDADGNKIVKDPYNIGELHPTPFQTSKSQ